MYKAIIFDYDGTLAERSKYVHYELRDFIKFIKPSVNIYSFEFESMVQDLIDFDANGVIEKNEVGRLFFNKYHINEDPSVFTTWWNKHIDDYVILFEDTENVLNYLKTKNYKLGIITNGISDCQRRKIQKSGLEKYFDQITISTEFGFAKPSKEIFDYTCKKLEVNNCESVFVGDVFSSDILGAYNAGLKPIWINTNPFHSIEIECLTISSLSQLKILL